MIVRTIREEEYKRCQELCALAFEYAMKDAERSPQETLSAARRSPSSRQELFWDSQWAAFADDDTTMLSTMTVIPYRAAFDGNDVLMMGIGGVATLPQYRRMGGIRACFEQALPRMAEDGAVLSYLYPFSTAFYRKFGYELGCPLNRWRLALRSVPRQAVRGTWRLLERGAALGEAIAQIDRQWQDRYNCMVRCEDVEYTWVGQANPFADRSYTYVYFRADGAPAGYLTFRPTVEEGRRTMECTRFVFADMEALLGLLALLKTLEADHSHVVIPLPEDVELGGVLPEWSFGDVQCSRVCNGMARVVNVQRALELARMRGEGSLVLEFSDGQIPGNNGRFCVRFAPGAQNAVERTQAQPDIVLGIQDFSRLILGGCGDIRWLPQVECLCPPEKAAQVFYRKPMFISQYF